MEMLHLLQERIQLLVKVVKGLEAEKEKLSKKNEQLEETIKSMEAAMLKESKTSDSLSKEKEMTQSVVDDLIKRIDTLLPHSE